LQRFILIAERTIRCANVIDEARVTVRAEEADMDTANQETVPIKPCCGCGVGLLEESIFCRLCGARQFNSPGVGLSEALPRECRHPSLPLLLATPAGRDACPPRAMESYKTSKLSHPILYHPVSGPLVKAVVEGVPACASHSVPRELPKKVLFALMAFPIWVMIILLSPLDAYASAKIIGQRI
jgi:hypothetical protein